MHDPYYFAGPICNSPITCAPFYVVAIAPYAIAISLLVSIPLLLLYIAIKKHMPTFRALLIIGSISLLIGVPSAAFYAPTIEKARRDNTYNKTMQTKAVDFNAKAYEPTKGVQGYTLVESGVELTQRKSSKTYPYIYFDYYETQYHEKFPKSVSPTYYKLLLISTKDAENMQIDFCSETALCTTGKLSSGREYSYGELEAALNETSPLRSVLGVTIKNHKNNAYIKLPGAIAIVISSDLQKNDFDTIFNNLKEVYAEEIEYKSDFFR